jgi:hypothetical protein
MYVILTAFLSVVCTGSLFAATVTIDAGTVSGRNPHFERNNTTQSWYPNQNTIQQLKDIQTERLRIKVNIKDRGATVEPDYYVAPIKLDAWPIMLLWGYRENKKEYEDNIYAFLKRVKFPDPDNPDPLESKELEGMYTGMVYLEVMNEPDGTWYHGGHKTPQQWADMFEAAYNAAQRINSELPDSIPQLKVGGPSTYKWNPDYLHECMVAVKEKGLKMDFVCWHEYVRPYREDYPAEIKKFCDTLNGWIDTLHPGAEILVTEWGWVAGGFDTNPSSEKLQKTAAFIASGNYFFLKGGADYIYQWCIGHARNKVKSQFVYKGNGKVYPFFNVLNMMSKMKDWVAVETIDGMDSNGVGVGGYGTIDTSGIAVMIWNYEGEDEDVTVSIPELPPVFKRDMFDVQTYCIDAEHSNFKSGGTDKLEEIDFTTDEPGGSFSTTIRLMKNAVAQVVLTPRGKVEMPVSTRYHIRKYNYSNGCNIGGNNPQSNWYLLNGTTVPFLHGHHTGLFIHQSGKRLKMHIKQFHTQ